jgi:hypothetical protein
MKRSLLGVVAVSLAAVLVACGERPQTAAGRKTDAKPWQGADNPYVAGGWKAGDKVSWEEQMRVRAQTQNDYNKVR